ncbi:hypothetical protein EJ110_NYTH44433 [Nymphaea thermarum]|nr:hypothetical protein EJ110_NYTH44433 [Nymphaea thermarum]
MFITYARHCSALFITHDQHCSLLIARRTCLQPHPTLAPPSGSACISARRLSLRATPLPPPGASASARRLLHYLAPPDSLPQPDASVSVLTQRRPTLLFLPLLPSSSIDSPSGSSDLVWTVCTALRHCWLLLPIAGEAQVAVLCLVPAQAAIPCFCFALSHRLVTMAASSSSTVNQTEIGGFRTENVPMQVINLRLTKENYFSWSSAMTMGIAARDRMTYIDGSNPEPARTSGVWHTWFLEDNQVKTWIGNSVSPSV